MLRRKKTDKVLIITKEMILAPAVDQKDLWETPDHIFEPLAKMFKFTHDPCCTKESAKCEYFWTPAEDGLSQDWYGASLFVNPPYSRGNIDKWVKKCYGESKNAKVIALLPVSTSADWFQKYVLGNTLHWVDKRIRFKGAPYTAPFSSVIVEFNRVNKNYTWRQ